MLSDHKTRWFKPGKITHKFISYIFLGFLGRYMSLYILFSDLNDQTDRLLYNHFLLLSTVHQNRFSTVQTEVNFLSVTLVQSEGYYRSDGN